MVIKFSWAASKALFSVFIICVLLMIGFSHLRLIKLDDSKVATNNVWLEWVKHYRKCVLNYPVKKNIPQNYTWYFLHDALSTCTGDTFDMVDIYYLLNKDDVKFIILPDKNQDVCTEVTLGIGNDIESEKKILDLLPNCRLHGADPMQEVGKPFETIGKYYEIAVSAESGFFNANVLVGPGIHNYVVKEVQTIGFVEFLKHYAKESKIDYLFMDNEGAEYDILPMFDKGGEIQNHNLLICQISVELHGPLTKYNMTKEKYANLMKRIMMNSTLIPLWSSAPLNHARMFLFNSDDNYCTEKYLQKWYLH